MPDEKLQELLGIIDGINVGSHNKPDERMRLAVRALRRAFGQEENETDAPATVRFQPDGFVRPRPDDDVPAETLWFPTIALDANELPFDLASPIPLRRYYNACLLPEYQQVFTQRTLQGDRHALNMWEKVLGNIDMREVASVHLAEFRDALLRRGLSPRSINNYWRELRPMFRDAVRRGLLRACPQLGVKFNSKLVKEPPLRQRPCITEDEVTRLWRATNCATYPANTRVPAPKLWRTAILLLWVYGVRRSDLLSLQWQDVVWSDRLIRFTAHKTGKLQGLPMTDLVEAHLRSVRDMLPRDAKFVLTTFANVGGRYRRKREGRRVHKRWQDGSLTTWNQEILPAAGLDKKPQRVTWKHFRQAAATRYNSVEPGLGSWILGHWIPGVTAAHYDLPTDRIRKAVESAPVPACFEQLE